MLLVLVIGRRIAPVIRRAFIRTFEPASNSIHVVIEAHIALLRQVAEDPVEGVIIETNTGSFGQLQLNAYEPLILSAIMESQIILTNTLRTFRTKCVDGITVNEEVLKEYIEKSIGIVTALNPVLGYDKSTELASEAMNSGKGILELVREKNLLTEDQIAEILDPKKMTGQEDH
jgi:aspartate ammonia-lyase